MLPTLVWDKKKILHLDLDLDIFSLDILWNKNTLKCLNT